MSTGVTFDTSGLVRAVARLVDDLDTQSRRVEIAEANQTATTLRSRVPKRTGRLAATVRAVPTSDGAAVTYGGTLPYARYIEKRSHAVAAGIRDAPARFRAACQDVAETATARL